MLHRKYRRYTKEVLEPLVASSFSVAEVLRLLGLRQAGGNHFNISTRIRQYGLDTSHFRGSAHNRGQIGKRKPAVEILIEKPDLGNRTHASHLRRALVEIGIPAICTGCGVGDEWRSLPLTLEIDHINGRHNDNRPEDVRFLRPNCHSQTETWCVRNVRASEDFAYYGTV